MRILHIIGSLDPAAGGPSESVRLMMTCWPIGYTGEVVTLDDPKAPYLAGLPFTVHALGPSSLNYGYTRKLVPWLRANRDRFDGVVVNGLWGYCGVAAWLALRHRKPYVVFTHGMLDPYFKRAFPLKHLKKWIYWILAEFWVLRGAFRVLFTTTEEARLAEQSFWLHRWHGQVVPYGAGRPVDGGSEDQQEAFLACCPAVRRRRFVLFLGRIHRKKGCDMLIEAFCKLAHEDPELHLVMAGPDQQGWAADLRAIAIHAGLQDRVHWPGMLKGEAKWGGFIASEVFILPSHQENFGIAVAEALACGRPVLLSDKVNIAAEIEGEGAGLVEGDTPAGTENLLRLWMQMSIPERQQMGERALECFDKHYDMTRNAEAILRLFRVAAGEPMGGFPESETTKRGYSRTR